MNKKVYLCDIEALKEGTNDKYGVSATLVFNEGLTYKELEQVIDEKYFYLSNYNSQNKIDKALKKINNMFDIGDANTIIDDLLELEKTLKGEDEET